MHFSMPLRRGFLLVLLLLPATLATAQEQKKPIRIVLHAPAPAYRALQYPLLPTLGEVTSGNALDFYKKAKEELDSAGAQAVDEDMERWAYLPIKELPVGDVRRALAPYSKALELIEKGALCEKIEWGHREGLLREGIGLVLPNIQDLRQFARLLSLRAHLELAEGKAPECLRTIRLGLSMSRQAAESPILISALVGIAISQIMLGDLEMAISQPGVPDMYWSLSDLPRPFIDMRLAMQGEQLWVYGTFPGLASLRPGKKGPVMTEEQVRKCVALLSSELPLFNLSRELGRIRLAMQIQGRHEVAKKALIAHGWDRETVERMPHVQAALLHAVTEYEQIFDELNKWRGFPYWEMDPRVTELDAMLRQRRKNPKSDGPAIPLADLFLPAVSKVFSAQARLQRHIDALRCVEAIRHHVSTHGGKLPDSLAEIKDFPTPQVDPFTGKPFVYRRNGAQATLTVAEGEGLPKDTLHLEYLLVLPGK